MDGQNSAVSVIVTRSRAHGYHRAYVRCGDFDAGYRDLNTGELFAASGYESFVSVVTAAMVRHLLDAADTEPGPDQLRSLAS